MNSALDLDLVRSGDDPGLELLGQGNQSLHDTLDVNDHGVRSTGEDSQLLVEEIAGQRDTLSHQKLIGRATDTSHIDPFGPLRLGVLDNLWILNSGQDHLREGRLVAVDDDVDLIPFEHSQVSLGLARAGRAKEDVRQVCGQHRAAPAVGQGGAHGMVQDVLRVLVVAYMGAV